MHKIHISDKNQLLSGNVFPFSCNCLGTSLGISLNIHRTRSYQYAPLFNSLDEIIQNIYSLLMSEPTQLTQFSPKIFNQSIFVMSSNYVCKKGRSERIFLSQHVQGEKFSSLRKIIAFFAVGFPYLRVHTLMLYKFLNKVRF